MVDCWLDIDGRCLYESPDNHWGFAYSITCIHPDYNNWIYIGKKAFTHKSTKRISKREIKATKTRKRVLSTSKDSGWLKYYGSSVELKSLVKKYGEQYFIRRILGYAKNKSELSLLEVEMQIKYNVLRRNDSFNSWIGCKVFKKHI